MIRCVPLPTEHVWRSFVPFGVDLKALRRPRTGAPEGIAWVYRSRVGTERFHQALRLYLMWRQSLRTGTGQLLDLEPEIAGSWLDAFAKIPAARYRHNELLVRVHNYLVFPHDSAFGWWRTVDRNDVEEAIARFLLRRPELPVPATVCGKRKRTHQQRWNQDVWQRAAQLLARTCPLAETARTVRNLRIAGMPHEADALLFIMRGNAAEQLDDMVRWVRPVYVRARMYVFRHCCVHYPGGWTEAMRDEALDAIDEKLRQIHTDALQRVRLKEPLLLRAVDAFSTLRDEPRLRDAFRFTFCTSLQRLLLACLDTSDSIRERAPLASAPAVYYRVPVQSAVPLDPQTVERCLRIVTQFERAPSVSVGATPVRTLDQSVEVWINDAMWCVRATGNSVVHMFRGRACMSAVFDDDRVRTLHSAHATYDDYDKALNAFSILCRSFDRVIGDTGLRTGKCPMCLRTLCGTARAFGVHPGCYPQ